jgi:cystathionine beta-synthase
MAVEAALRFARELQDSDPDAAARAVIVVILPDGGRGYLSKIFNDSWMRSYGFLGADEGATVGDVLRTKTGSLPALVHTHPTESVRDAIEILHEYGVSQMPVVGAEPPVKVGEVAGAVSERDLLDAVFSGRAALSDRVDKHMGAPFPLIGAGESVDDARRALEAADALMVVDDGQPVGVLTRHDLLGFLAR